MSSTPATRIVALEASPYSGHCAFCGLDSDTEPMVLGTDGNGVACTSIRACEARQVARDAHLSTRWSITEAGVIALAAYRNPEPEPTPPAAPQRAPRPRMTPATLEARARQRAHVEHVHIFAVAGMPGCYTTKSKSNPSERYELVAGPDGIIGCSCAGFYYRQSCKHAEALKARLAREAVQAARCTRQLQEVAA